MVEKSGNTVAAETDAAVVEQRKKQREAEKALRDQDVYNNFATPLVGTFLNLPKESVSLKCPSCGITEMSQVQNELKWWATEINRIFGCFFVTLCCCCCFNYYIPCKQTDRNHYCKNCGCSMKHVAPLPPKARKH